jgi:VIT1/CCC1 family predicted Fe2+/Mn2+ transporter
MSDSAEKPKDVIHALEHPVEAAKALEHEAEVGASPRTPLIAITGIAFFLGAIFVILLAIALTLYFVYGGK